MKVSIVLPCYNSVGHLGRCLSSLFRQTHGDLELIAVDDGSTDGTLDQLREAIVSAPYPMSVMHQANAGACTARNAGMRAATGGYVQFMDADDELLPEKIAHQLAVLESAGWPEIAAGRMKAIKADGLAEPLEASFGAADSDPWLALMRHRLGRTSSLLLSREGVISAGGWNPRARSSQEYELLFAMLKRGARAVHDNAALTLIHRRSGSISLGAPAEAWQRYIELRARILDHARMIGNPGLEHFEQALFDSLRILYPLNPEQAVAYYRNLLPKDFRPTVSTATGRAYLLLHRVLGFDRANRLRMAIGRAGSTGGKR